MSGSHATRPQDGRRSQAGLPVRAPRVAVPRPPLTRAPRVRSAFRRRPARLSLCSPGGGEDAGGDSAPVQKCFIWRSKFCTIGPPLSFCIVCACACSFVSFFFFSFSFLRKLCFSFHTRLSLLTPAFAFRAGAREREKYTSNSRMRPNKTEQQIPAHFVLDETKPSKSTWKKWHTDDSAVTLRGRLSDAPLDLIIQIFFFFNSHSGIL